MPASVYEPIGSALKKSLLGPRSSGLDSKMASSFQKSLLTRVSFNPSTNLIRLSKRISLNSSKNIYSCTWRCLIAKYLRSSTMTQFVRAQTCRRSRRRNTLSSPGLRSKTPRRSLPPPMAVQASSIKSRIRDRFCSGENRCGVHWL